MYFFGELENLLFKLGVFWLELFDDGGLDFGDMLVLVLVLRVFGAEGEVSVGVGWCVSVMVGIWEGGVRG